MTTVIRYIGHGARSQDSQPHSQALRQRKLEFLGRLERPGEVQPEARQQVVHVRAFAVALDQVAEPNVAGGFPLGEIAVIFTDQQQQIA